MTHVVTIDIITGHEGKVICILFCRLFFIAYLSKNHAVSQNLYNYLWKYNKLSNEILLKCLFLKQWNKWGRQSLIETWVWNLWLKMT